jgi:hypothetical protein
VHDKKRWGLSDTLASAVPATFTNVKLDIEWNWDLPPNELTF